MSSNIVHLQTFNGESCGPFYKIKKESNKFKWIRQIQIFFKLCSNHIGYMGMYEDAYVCLLLHNVSAIQPHTISILQFKYNRDLEAWSRAVSRVFEGIFLLQLSNYTRKRRNLKKKNWGKSKFSYISLLYIRIRLKRKWLRMVENKR